ncbi:hypothetical protein B0T17DRAFT_505442 [Bombardia bombarda]|uniref:Uncharacterized protein n=1 Tax=Bombardia bombarda TaxID=252184 RepID=A0AA39X7M3_9PEZI|nr:hypothetical protein B0T17DRAFT_505442 [Bombardia bombarda]
MSRISNSWESAAEDESWGGEGGIGGLRARARFSGIGNFAQMSPARERPDDGAEGRSLARSLVHARPSHPPRQNRFLADWLAAQAKARSLPDFGAQPRGTSPKHAYIIVEPIMIGATRENDGTEQSPRGVAIAKVGTQSRQSARKPIFAPVREGRYAACRKYTTIAGDSLMKLATGGQCRRSSLPDLKLELHKERRNGGNGRRGTDAFRRQADADRQGDLGRQTWKRHGKRQVVDADGGVSSLFKGMRVSETPPWTWKFPFSRSQ